MGIDIASPGASAAALRQALLSSSRIRAKDVFDLASIAGLTLHADGASGDGAVLNQLLATYKTIELPAGYTFIVDQSLLLPDGGCIIGSGYSSVLKAAAGLNAPVIVNNTNGSSGHYLANFRIDGNRNNQANNAETTGIKLYKAPDSIADKLWIFDTMGHSIHFNNVGAQIEGQCLSRLRCRRAGWYPTNTFGSCIAVTNGYDVTIDSCHAYDSAKAGLRLDGSGFQVINCIAKRNGNGGLYTSNFTDSSIVAGDYSDNFGPYITSGIRLNGATRIRVKGVLAQNNGGAGIEVLNGSNDCIIEGNTCRNNGQTPGDLNTTILYLGSVVGNFNLGDTVTQGGASATISSVINFGGGPIIRLTGITGGSFTAAAVTDTTTGATATASQAISTTPESHAGIAVYDQGTGCLRTKVKNNTVIDDQATATHTYGIVVDNNSDYTEVEGNTILCSAASPTPLLALPSSKDNNICKNNIGPTIPFNDNVNRPVTPLTGTLLETIMSDFSAGANELGRGCGGIVRAAGTFSGANDVKTIRLYLGTAFGTVALVAPASATSWSFEAYFTLTVLTTVRLTLKGFVDGQPATVKAVNSSASNFANAQHIRTTGQLANTGDTINQTMFTVDRVR